MNDSVDTERDNRGQWFVIHTLSGHENKVRDTILRQLQNGDQVPVYEAFIPTEKVTEVRQGKKTTMTRKLFPGYIWVRMDLYDDLGMVDEKAWYFVRSVQGVLSAARTSRLRFRMRKSRICCARSRPAKLWLPGRRSNLKLVKWFASKTVRLRISRVRFRKSTTNAAS